MSDTIQFLDALFGAAEGEITFEIEGERGHFSTAQQIEANAGDLDFLAVTDAGQRSFVYSFAQADNQIEPLPPTAVLKSRLGVLNFWACVTPIAPEVAQVFDEYLQAEDDELLPVPGRRIDGGEWTLHAFNEVAYTIQELEALLPPLEEEPLGVYADANILAPYDEANPDLQREIVISLGANRDSTKWKPMPMKLGQLIAILCKHDVGAKDGKALVLGEVIGGRRLKTAMKMMSGVGLDIDNGMSGAEIDNALKSLGVMALRYSTHSHQSTTTDFKRDAILKYGGDREIDDELIREWLKSFHGWVAEIADTATIEAVDHTERGVVVRIAHAPMPKSRVIIPFAENFVVSNVARSQRDAMEMWSKVPEALAEKLGVVIDKTGTDPSRLFYFPRHDKDKPFEISLFGGPLFDWRSLQLTNPLADLAADLTKGSSKSKTDAGKALGRWFKKAGHGFQLIPVLEEHCPEKLRGSNQHGQDIECPFDHDHSNAGDPDDRACMATNAGDLGDYFVIKCQHDSCRDYTNLDHLGKMLEDGWFPKAVIDDEDFNAVEPENAPDPEAATRLSKQDKAIAHVEKMIEALEKKPAGEAVNAILEEMGNIPDAVVRDRLFRALKDKTGSSVATLRGLAKKMHKTVVESGEEVLDEKGVATFYYRGAFHADEAMDACKRALLRANNGVPQFTCASDTPVIMHKNPVTGRLAFPELDSGAFWSEICDRLFFVRQTENGDSAREQVPQPIAAQFYNTAYKHLPQAPEVLYTPVFNQEGVLIQEPGWYEDLGIVMADIGFAIDDIPAEPTEEEVEEAARFFKEEILVDYPFLDHTLDGFEMREPSETNAMAMIITPFMRRMIFSPTPVFFITKPKPGTGGTLLGTVPMILFDGEEGWKMGYHGENDEETRKSLLSAIMETRSHLFYDDVKEFNSRPLLQAITSMRIGGRVLGKSQNVERPNTFNWVATGNNPVIKEDMARRIAWIRLNLKGDDVQDRTYRHADPKGFLLDNRSKAVRYILLMIQNWIAKGCPDFEVRGLASFEDWSRKVGGVLMCAGFEGFLDNRRQSSGNMDQAAERELVKEWMKRFHHEPTTFKALFEFAMTMDFEIIEGNSDDQRRARFRNKLNQLEGCTYTIDDRRVMVRRSMDAEKNTVFILDHLEDAEKAA